MNFEHQKIKIRTFNIQKYEQKPSTFKSKSRNLDAPSSSLMDSNVNPN
jgi:hypothetical protein